MQKFADSIFEQLDNGSQINQQVYLLNSNFQDQLSDLLKLSLPNLKKNEIAQNMAVLFNRELG